MWKFIDLFSGIGGFHVALRKKGLNCVFASEIDKSARAVYEKNFNLKPVGDICMIDNKSIPRHDILCAGFPCQSFSISGKRKGFNDARGQLFYQIVRIAKYHKPTILMLENVKMILTIDNGYVHKEIDTKLQEIGYRVKHVVLNSGNYDIAQKRERVYFIAIRNDSPLSFTPPSTSKKFKVLSDIIVPNIDCKNLIINRKDIKVNKKEQKRARKPIRIGSVNKGGQGERIYSTSGQAITLSANGGGVGNRTGLYYIDGKVRRLHIDEAKAVMGFSRQHIVSDGVAGYRQLGNAVIPAMIEHLYNNVKEEIHK